jgi:hypothetical protein
MTITNISEKVELVFPSKKRCGYGVDRSITPTLVIESASFVEIFEEGLISFTTPEIHVGDLKITPD